MKSTYTTCYRIDMRWLACVAAVALPLQLAAREIVNEPPSVLVLSNEHAGNRGRETVLIEALKIYTRDLHRVVRLGGSAPSSLDPETIARTAEGAREAGAEVVVWFGERGGIPVLYALRVATLDLRETTVEADDPQQAARALALKVRALLAARADQVEWSVPAPSPSPAPSVPPASPTPSPSPSPIAVAAPPSPAPIAVAPVAARRIWVELAATYGVTVPTNTSWVRHGLTLRAALPWGRLPVSAFVDAAFTTAPSTTVDGHAVSGRIWPVGIGVELRLRRPRWQISGGPRISLQIIDVEAQTVGGPSGSARRYSAGLGILTEAAWLFSRYVAALLSISAEALVERQQFLAGGSGSTDLGYVQFGFNAGLLFSIP